MSFKRSFHGTTSNTILFEEQPSSSSNTHEGVRLIVNSSFYNRHIFAGRHPNISYQVTMIILDAENHTSALEEDIGHSQSYWSFSSCFGTSNEILLQITFCLLAKIFLGGIFRTTHYRLPFEHLVTIFSPP